jgi:hypothetical protein
MHKRHNDLREKPTRCEEGKTTGVDQPVHTIVTMSNWDAKYSLKYLVITTQFSLLPTGNNNNNNKNHMWQETTEAKIS